VGGKEKNLKIQAYHQVPPLKEIKKSTTFEELGNPFPSIQLKDQYLKDLLPLTIAHQYHS